MGSEATAAFERPIPSRCATRGSRPREIRHFLIELRIHRGWPMRIDDCSCCNDDENVSGPEARGRFTDPLSLYCSGLSTNGIISLAKAALTRSLRHCRGCGLLVRVTDEHCRKPRPRQAGNRPDHEQEDRTCDHDQQPKLDCGPLRIPGHCGRLGGTKPIECKRADDAQHCKRGDECGSTIAHSKRIVGLLGSRVRSIDALTTPTFSLERERPSATPRTRPQRRFGGCFARHRW
jgi:hypothetical protein